MRMRPIRTMATLSRCGCVNVSEVFPEFQNDTPLPWIQARAQRATAVLLVQAAMRLLPQATHSQLSTPLVNQHSWMQSDSVG